jgi:hypothetical protein
LLVGVALALMPVAGAACTKTNDPAQPANGANAVTNGTAKDGSPVFPLPEDPIAAIRQANLSALPDEVLTYHVHAHLDLVINGHPVTVPEDIGVIRDANKKITGITAVHTDDTSGLIHVEAAKEEPFSIGQLFAEWGVKLDKTCLATYCTDESNQLLGFLNGELVGDPASIPLTSHANIYIWFGPKGTNPKAPVFAFPAEP